MSAAGSSSRAPRPRMSTYSAVQRPTPRRLQPGQTPGGREQMEGAAAVFEASPELLDQRPLEPVGERHVDLLADDRPDKRLKGAGHDERAEAARALDQRAEALISQGQGIQGRQVIVDPEAARDSGRRGFQLG